MYCQGGGIQTRVKRPAPKRERAAEDGQANEPEEHVENDNNRRM